MKFAKPRLTVLGISGGTLALTAVVLYGVFLLVGNNKAEISLVIGAIIGTEAGIVIYHRQPGSASSLSAKALIGAGLCVATLIVSLIMQLLTAWMQRPAISIPVSAAGAFVLPFLLFNPMWNALERNRQQQDGGDA